MMKELIGKKIKSVFISLEGNILIFKTTEDNFIAYKLFRNCCEASGFGDLYVSSILSGNEIVKIEKAHINTEIRVDSEEGELKSHSYQYIIHVNDCGTSKISFNSHYDGYMCNTILKSNIESTDLIEVISYSYDKHYSDEWNIEFKLRKNDFCYDILFREITENSEL